MFEVAQDAWRAVSDLFMYLMIALCVDLVFARIRWPIERSIKARRPPPVAAGMAPADEAEEDDQPFAAADRNERYGRQPPTGGNGRSRVEPRL